jgi:hypothetical protein
VTSHSLQRTVVVLLAVAGALFALAPDGLGAQEVRGRALERGSETPISGAYLTLEDTAGSRADATLSGEDGAFRLAASAAGRYRVVVQRIGFETWTSEPFVLEAGETLSRGLEVPVRPVELSGIVATGERRCRTAPRDAEQVARLWSEARKALEAARWTDERGRLRFRLRSWHRQLSTEGTVRRQVTDTTSGPGVDPFVSLPAEELAEEGYVRVDEGFRDYYGPDARALLSRAFQETHCFWIEETEEEPASRGWVGLGFRPVTGREVPDIRGVMWLDRASAALQRVDFRYVNADLPDGAAETGGQVEFRLLANGAYIVRRWHIRMPKIARSVQRFRPVPGEPPEIRHERVVEGWQEQGAEVVAVRTPGGRRLSLAPPARAAGTVTGPDGEPLPGVTVAVEGTDRETVTDSAGRFRLRLPGDGRYRLAVRSPGGTPVEDSAATARVEAEAGGTARARLRLQSRQVLAPDRVAAGAADTADEMERILDRLRGDSLGGPEVRVDSAAPANGGEGEAVVIGRVRDTSSGAPVASARVRIGPRTAVTDSAGRFRISGIRSGPQPVEVEYLGRAVRRPDIHLPAADTIRPTLELRADPVRVSDLQVEVEGTPLVAKMEGFWERKGRGMGEYLTRERLERVPGNEVSGALRQVPGLRLRPCPGRSPDCWLPANTRGPGMDFEGGGSCTMALFVDGRRRDIDSDIGVDVMPRSDIEAVEVYTSTAQLPSRYGGLVSGNCGAVLIWTRTGEGEGRS